jgi:hypothetical protein
VLRKLGVNFGGSKMKKIISSIMLLGLVGCAEPKFFLGNCIKGESHTFVVIATSDYTDRYLIRAIKPTTSVIYNTTSWMDFKVAEKVLKKVECEF